MAEVWRALDTRLGREVAIKRLRVDLATDQTFQARFQREAHSAAGLNHPNIVSVYDTGEAADAMTGITVPYIVMELVEGRTLRDVLRSGEEITPERAFGYLTGVCQALSYSHYRDIVHRDIKPANVMITPSDRVKVMDFGIARAVSDTSATMTQTAAVIGTAQYLSPEQARGEQVDARSDIYSTGCLIYELLTGRPPFLGDSPVSVAYQHVRETPIPPSTLNPAITPEMDAVVLKALAKTPANRYQSAHEMADDCQRILSGIPVTAQLAPVIPMQPTEVLSPTRATRALPVDEESEWDKEWDKEEPGEDLEEVVEAGRPKRRVSAATWVLIVLLVMVLGALGFFVWKVLSSDPTENFVTVPDVVGFQEAAATEQIENAQLVAVVKHDNGPAEGRGTVMTQSPRGDSSVQVGSTITITINDGPPVAVIPESVVGMSATDAIRALRDAGFTNVTVMEAPASQETPDSVADQVLSVVPATGTRTATDTAITLYVATGVSTIPNVIGMTTDDALNALTAAGFTNVDPPRERQTNDAPEGTVVSVLPNVGESWARSQKVIVEYAVPLPTPTPQPSTPSSTSPSPGGPTPGG